MGTSEQLADVHNIYCVYHGLNLIQDTEEFFNQREHRCIDFPIYQGQEKFYSYDGLSGHFQVRENSKKGSLS
jgi:hypothetical protein